MTYSIHFYQYHLPFELTGAQKKVLKEIRTDTAAGHQMNRLLQGDVGSGKTIVALLAMLLAIDNGFQSCMMAPTEILARQHFTTVSELLKDFPVNVKSIYWINTGQRTEDNSEKSRRRNSAYPYWNACGD